MQLSPQQAEFLKKNAKTAETLEWRGILESYILQIKDECIRTDALTKDAARCAIEQFADLINRIDVAAGNAKEEPKIPLSFK